MKLDSVGLIVNYKKDKTRETACRIINWLNSKKLRVYIEGNMGKKIGKEELNCLTEKFLKKVDLIISLGGDGTLLRAARLAAAEDIPVFGVNLGGLGFLTQIGIDDDYVITYSADGLVISTSTGSTAYSLSAGGPIVNPNIDSIILTPICPHTLSARPFIIGENDQVKIKLESSEEKIMVTIDGQEGFVLKPKDEVIIKKSDHKARLITFKEKSFYAILREKLRWSGQIDK